MQLDQLNSVHPPPFVCAPSFWATQESWEPTIDPATSDTVSGQAHHTGRGEIREHRGEDERKHGLHI